MSTGVTTQPGQALDGSAFDFLPGEYTVKMRRRKVSGDLEVLSDWNAFDATATFRRMLDGFGFFEEFRMEQPHGVTYSVGTRFFNPQTNVWTIYWANQKDGGWQSAPMTGGIAAEDGMIFTMDDTLEGKPVLTRYYWRTPSYDHPSWEQSFSNDGGVTWTSNWVMEFSRKPA